MTKFITRSVAAICTITLATSCATTYDSQGRRRDVVTPEGAVIGAVAAGLIGYSIAKNRHKKNRYHRGHHGGYYDDGYGYGRRRGGRCDY